MSPRTMKTVMWHFIQCFYLLKFINLDFSCTSFFNFNCVPKFPSWVSFPYSGTPWKVVETMSLLYQSMNEISQSAGLVKMVSDKEQILYDIEQGKEMQGRQTAPALQYGNYVRDSRVVEVLLGMIPEVWRKLIQYTLANKQQ